MLHGMITRGTTPTQVFELPFNSTELQDLSITYRVKDTIVLQKHFEECSFENNTVIVELSQSDTLLFPADKTLQIQIKVLTNSNKVFASQIYFIKINEIFDQEEME